MHKKSIGTSKTASNHHPIIIHVINHLLRHPLKFLLLFTAIVAMVATAHASHRPLRTAVGRILLDSNISQNTTTSFKQLSATLGIYSGVTEKNDTHAVVDYNLLVHAFVRKDLGTEYIITFEDLHIPMHEINKLTPYKNTCSPKDHLLLVRVGLGEGGRNTTKDNMHYEVCHLINNADAQREMKRNNPTEHIAIKYTGKGDYNNLFVPPPGAHTSRLVSHPLNPPYMVNKITKKMREELQTYLMGRKNKSNNNNKQSKPTNKSKKEKRKRGGGGQFEKKKPTVVDESTQTPTTNDNDVNKSPKQKKERPNSARSNQIIESNEHLARIIEENEINDRKNKIKELQQKLQNEVLDTQKKIVELGIAMSEKVQQGIEAQSELEKLQHEEEQRQQQQQPPSPPVNNNNNNSSVNGNNNTTATLPPNDEDVTMEEADEAAATAGSGVGSEDPHPPAIDESKHPSATWDFNKYNDKNAAPITYTLPDGRIGKLEGINNGLIFVDELYNNLINVPEGTDNPKGDKARAGKNPIIAVHGTSQHFIPAHTTLIQSGKLNAYKKSNEVVKRLKRVFSGKQSSFSDESRATGYGCSDEATSMIQCGAWLALLNEIELEIDEESVANACPSRRTLARWELMLATDCMATNIEEMKRDMDGRDKKYCGVISDHGHRGGQDHFVVVVVWAGYDENGNKTLKFFCPSIDSAGHSAQEAANGVKNVLDRALAGTNIEAKVITGDAGGGGAVQHLYKKLVEMGIMDENCKETNCSLHGLQKAIENASKKTMGDQGMGCRSPFQMLYLFARLMSTLKKEAGLRNVDTMWSKVSEQLQTNEEWQSIASDKMKLAWREFINTVEAVQLENGDEEGVGNLEKRMSKAPREIQDPVWTRWASVSSTWSHLLVPYL